MGVGRIKLFFQLSKHIFLLILERGLWKLMGHPSTKLLILMFNTINYILIDLGLLSFYLRIDIDRLNAVGMHSL